MIRLLLVVGVGFCVVSCGKHDDPLPVEHISPGAPPPKLPGSAAALASPTPATGSAGSASAATAPPATPPPAEKPTNGPGPTTPEVADAPAGNPPPDGKYANVIVEGVTVPMVQIMAHGTVVLVDTDGKKPRTWEEQYKKKTAKLPGQLDIHKTNTRHDGKFDDVPIDREGLWTIDSKGNITKH